MLEQQIAAQPDVASAFHVDREWFEIRLARPLPADEVLARYIDALSAAHREYARRRAIVVPDEQGRRVADTHRPEDHLGR